MNPLPAAFALTSIAFMIGVLIVAFSIQYRHVNVVFAGSPLRVSDDMGTSGVGYPADALPTASSSTR
jgi:hypothetical protein